jgi:hypothetical protein
MNNADFHIGLEFWSSRRLLRCTDRGIRTIIAIRIDAAEIIINEAGTITPRTLLREEAERDAWFEGLLMSWLRISSTKMTLMVVH